MFDEWTAAGPSNQENGAQNSYICAISIREDVTKVSQSSTFFKFN